MVRWQNSNSFWERFTELANEEKRRAAKRLEAYEESMRRRRELRRKMEAYDGIRTYRC